MQIFTNSTSAGGGGGGGGNVTIQENKATERAAYLNYASTNVDDTAWVQITAATPRDYVQLEIFDSGGFMMRLATGGVGVETELHLIRPGGPGIVPDLIPAGTRLSVRALNAGEVAALGEISVNGIYEVP